MMFLKAPYPVLQNVTVLPSPEFSDTESALSTITLKRAMNGTRYTHLRTSDVFKFLWSFNLTRKKSLELIEFHRSYADKLWQITDHKNRELIGICMTNPLELTPQSRGVYGTACSSAKTSYESVTVDLEFEGYIL